MAKKVSVTKTTNPLHFEDLEPHRFEDLVRRLLYSFRDWALIEPTGRGGSDDGFDVRAWERVEAATNVGEDGEEGAKGARGRVWQVQCKRERSLTPSQVRAIIRESVDKTAPPHGFILAAAANLSKKGHDAFREELRSLGVREYQFWGKDHLEDQLALPQNDDVLFTFFGLSRGLKRRSRVAEVKFALNNKNRIQRLVFEGGDPKRGTALKQPFLLRDIAADSYPHLDAYPDFSSRRRWEEHPLVQVEPDGMYFQVREYYAWVDPVRKQFSVTPAVDLTRRKHPLDEANAGQDGDVGRAAERHWRHLPLGNQGKLLTAGFVRFDDILAVDDKGDTEHDFPQLFVEFGEKGPFSRDGRSLRLGREYLNVREYEQVAGKFPGAFGKLSRGRTVEAPGAGLTELATRRLRHIRGGQVFYGFDGAMAGLSEGDIIRFAAEGQRDFEAHVEVTSVRVTTVKDEALSHGKDREEFARQTLVEHAGRSIRDAEEVRAVEFCSIILPFEADHVVYTDSTW